MTKIRKLSKKEIPTQLLEIPDPPKQLYMRGNMPPADALLLCVVGARAYTSYGKDNCEKLIASLAGKNVVIVSGLAIGIDTIAHKAALAAGLQTMAVPGSGISDDVLYPATNRSFAKKILEAGGGILSEFEPDFVSTQWAFPQRNRIMAGLCKAVLVVEAERKSGTLITARLATEYNRDVLTIPGSINSPNSQGPHLLLRMGATPITCIDDLHEALGFEIGKQKKKDSNYDDCSPQEKEILMLLQDSMPRDDLMHKLDLPASEINVLLSLLEMKGYIKEDYGQLHLF